MVMKMKILSSLALCGVLALCALPSAHAAIDEACSQLTDKAACQATYYQQYTQALAQYSKAKLEINRYFVSFPVHCLISYLLPTRDTIPSILPLPPTQRPESNAS